MKKLLPYKKPVFIIALIISVILNIFYAIDSFLFPVKLHICSGNYSDCFIHAKYKNMSSCEDDNEKLSWYCNSTDPKNITCRESLP